MTEPLPDDRELYDPFLDIVLNDMRDRSEDWCVVLAPLPDGLGWKADFLIGDQQIRAGAAGDPVATKSIVLAIGRGIAAIDEACEEMSSDEELT
jgi:hypothetical protein